MKMGLSAHYSSPHLQTLTGHGQTQKKVTKVTLDLAFLCLQVEPVWETRHRSAQILAPPIPSCSSTLIGLE